MRRRSALRRRVILLPLLLVLSLISALPQTAAAAAGPAATLNTLWNTYGDQGGHWTGADSTVSVPLPDGRVAWLFSDTFLGTVAADHSRPKNAPFIHNSIVVQQGGQLVQTVTGGTPSAPTSLVNATAADEFYWVSSGVVQGGALKAFYGKYKKAGDGALDFIRIGTAVVTYALPGLTVSSVTDLTLDTKVGWGSAIVTDGGYDYIYGTEDTDGYKFAHLARVPTGNLSGAWEFWTGSAWSTQDTQSARLFSGGGTEFSVVRAGGQFVVVTQDGNTGFSPWIVAYTSASPAGPFTGPIYLHKAPEGQASGGWQTPYDAQVHQEQAAPGTLLMSYNNNSLNSDDNYTDARIYRPRFVDITWPPVVPDPAAVPAKPTGLAVTTDIGGTGQLNWTAPAGSGLSYWVYQRDVTAGQTHFTRIPDAANTTSQPIGGLKDGHTYEYRVSAANSAGEGQFSTTVSVTAHVTPPPAPANLRATPGTDGDVTLAWDAVPGSNVRYLAEKRDVTAGETEFTEAQSPNPSATSTTITGLVNGHTYEFRVSARNGGGPGVPSTVVTAAVVVAPPAAPAGLTAVAQGDGGIKLSWTGAPGLWYWIYQRDVTGGEAGFTKLEYPITDGTTFTAGWLLNGHTYEFKVTAIGKAGVESPPSTVVSAVARYDLPAAPAGLTAVPQGDGAVKLTWTAAPGLWYWVYQRDATANEADFTKLAYPITDGSSFTAGLLLNDHAYDFKITAINSGGEGPASATVRATAHYAAPAAPTNLTAVPGDGTVALSWTGVPDSWYWIYQRDVTAGDTAFTKLEYPITDGTTFTAGLLANGHTYEFKVSATAAGGEGAASNVVSAKPLPPLPSQITGLTATPRPTGDIDLAWTALPNVYYWVYYRDVTAGAAFTKLPYPASEPKNTVGWLANGHVYEFKVAATNLAGDGPDSALVRATSQLALPAAPANLAGSAAGDGSVDLSWDSAGPNLFYWLYRRDVTAGETGFTKSGFFTDKTFASWEGLQDSHVYEFQVRGENAAGLGPASNTVQVTSHGGLPAPPTNLTASPGNGKVVLNWTASPTADVYYWIYYRDATTGERFKKLEIPVSGTSFSLSPLTNGHTYEFKIAATNWAGDSRSSAVVNARPLPPVPAAASLTAIAGNGEVGLGWNAVDQATDFWVEYRDVTAGQGSFQRLPYPVQGWALTVRPLANGHRYEFRVFSANVAGQSGPSNVVSAMPVPPPPAAPSNLRAVAGNGKVSLTWNASPTPPVYYWVYYRPQGHSDWYYFNLPASGTSFTATGLLNGFTYEFKVTAANLGGQSPASNVVSAKPFLPLPAAPSNLSVTAGDKQATLTWNMNNPLGAAWYWIYFQPQGQSAWYYYAQPAGRSPVTVFNLLNGFTYSFKVTAANASGQTIATNVFTVRPLPPLPAAPGNIRATARDGSEVIDVSWDPSPGQEFYYIQYRNASDDGPWQWWDVAIGHTSVPFHQWPVGVRWEFRVSVRNAAGEVFSQVASEVSNVWTKTFQDTSNSWNGGNVLAGSMVRSLGLFCDTAVQQHVCFKGPGTRPFTIGDYFFFPYSRTDLNKLVKCEADQRIWLRKHYNGYIAANRGYDLLQHEGFHTWHAARYSLYAMFAADYQAARLASLLTPPYDDFSHNAFEVVANLWHGHYVKYDSNAPVCGYH